jgi:hypothetical protein
VTTAVQRRLRVLYLMHVDWGWIRQRPHHLAEGLAARHDVQVLYPVSWRRSALTAQASAVRRRGIVQVPLRRRWSVAAAANSAWYGSAVRGALAAFQPDVVWVTHPRLEPLLPDPLPRGTALVYDCMDDAVSFPDTRVESRGVPEAEARLGRRAAQTFTSSDRLAALLASRGFARERIEVVRNAAPDEAAAPLPPTGRSAGAPLRGLYYGTISSWLDFDALVAALDAVPELTVELVGPREARVPEHPRLRIRGPVPHDALPGLAREADVLLVPFRRTPLVEAVDPVKMYEYVALGREIVCLRWPEVEQFAPFAHLYDSPSHLVSVIQGLARGALPPRGSAEERSAFLQRNRWASRVEQVENALARVREERGRAA